MSILDSINNAEREAEKKKEDARSEARDIINEATTKARRKSDEQLKQRRDENKEKLDVFTKNTEQSYASYFDSRRKENLKLAEKARVNLDRAADYIVAKVIGQ